MFIGYDAESQTIIAHWLDSFGARYSTPHGTGSITGNTIQFIIPYKGSPFKDTLTYNPVHRHGYWSSRPRSPMARGSSSHATRSAGSSRVQKIRSSRRRCAMWLDSGIGPNQSL